MAAPQFEILTVPGVSEPGRDGLRQQCYDVRIDVFHHEQKFPLDTEIDDLDPTATHILLRLVPSLEPAGTMRCTKHAGYYKLSRLAVLEEYRQHHLGRALVLALHEHVKQDAERTGEHDCVTIKCHSQIPVKGFYARLGYEPEGDEFDEDGAPHQLMVVHLSLSD